MSKHKFLIIMYGKNEEINIDNAIFMSKLKRDFIFIDGNSTDKTRVILKEQKIKFIIGESINLPTLKNVGYQYAKENKFKWILELDADEIISEKTLSYLDNLDKQNIDSYSLNFKMVFEGKSMNFVSHRPKIRFYSVEKTFPKGNKVVDYIFSKRNKILSKEFYILNKNKTDFINLVKKQVQKADNFSREVYTENSEQGILKKFVSRKLHKNLLLTAFARFSYYYFFKLAFLDGKAGLYYCFNYAFIIPFLMSSRKS